MATQFVNQVNFPIPATAEHQVRVAAYPELDQNAWLIPQLVSAEENTMILSALEHANWLPVSITGMSGNWEPGDPIGSWRASSYIPEYAETLWARIKDQIPTVRTFTDADNTDWDGHETWEAVGVSPLLRFIKYTPGGWLVTHYDAPYVQDDQVRTLQSLVIYLHHDETLTGGATRYLTDPQAHLPVTARNLSDQIRAADEEEVRLRFLPENNTGVIFDHRMLHDAEAVGGAGTKVIIRTDIMYRKVH